MPPAASGCCATTRRSRGPTRPTTPRLHPGLWLAFGDISGADSWRNKAPVEHEAFVEQPTGGEGRGSFAVRNAYRAAPGQPLYAREVCRVAVVVRPSGYLLVLRSEFTPVGRDLVFGDQEEMGLGVASPRRSR